MSVRRILCAVEMRLDDINVLTCACLIARPFRASVDTFLLRPGHLPPTAGTRTPPRPSEIDVGHEAEFMFAELLGATPGLRIAGAVSGSAPRSVLQRAEECSADLIVLGSRPAPTADGADAITSELSRTAGCPVMTVPTTERPLGMSRILLPVDFSEATEGAIEWTRLLAQRFSASVHVLHAAGSGALRGSPVRRGRSLRTSRERRLVELRKIEQRLRAAGVGCTSSIAEQGTTHAILACREREDSDLIVMGLHHDEDANGVRAAAQGMVATIRSRAPVPVLSMTTAGEEEDFIVGSPIVQGWGRVVGEAMIARHSSDTARTRWDPSFT